MKPESLLYQVYLAERNATGALLDFYQVVIYGSFASTLEAVIRFARFNSDRFRLLDALRARAVADQFKKDESAFIEAGSIHDRRRI